MLFTPGPTNVPLRILKALLEPMIHHRGEEFKNLYSELVEKLRELLKTDGEVLVLTSSGTGGIEMALANLVHRGDKVLAPIYGTFSERLAEAVEARGATVVKKKLEPGVGLDSESARALVEEHSDADFLLLVYNDTSPGVMLRELGEICRRARDEGVMTIVDAISAVGGAPLEVDGWCIDVLVGASQKCIGAPPGVSFVSFSEEALERAEKRRPSSAYFDLRAYRRSAKVLETPYTPAVNLFRALLEALEMIFEIGRDNWIALHEARAEALYRALELLGFRPFVEPRFRSSTVLGLVPPDGVDPGLLKRELRERYGVCIASGLGEFRNKIVRIGNMGSLSWRDLLVLAASLAEVLAHLGVEVDALAALRAVGEGARETGLAI